jgi:hypothetical protein
MCLSQPAPKAPTIVYQGPSQADIRRQAKALDTYRMQSAEQQKSFADALQKQIDTANAEAKRQADELAQQRAAFDSGVKTEAEKAKEALAAESQKAALDQAAAAAAAASENAAVVQSSYGVNTAQVTPANAQTTEPPQPKKKQKESLKIMPGSVSTTTGTGINIGV